MPGHLQQAGVSASLTAWNSLRFLCVPCLYAKSEEQCSGGDGVTSDGVLLVLGYRTHFKVTHQPSDIHISEETGWKGPLRGQMACQVRDGCGRSRFSPGQVFIPRDLAEQQACAAHTGAG